MSAYDRRSASIAGPGRSCRLSLDEEKRTVKRNIVVVAGLVTLAAAAGLAVRGWAQAPTAPRPLQTRVGLLNMVQVLKNYKKFMAMEQSIKKRAEELEKTLEPYKNEINAIRTALQDPK